MRRKDLVPITFYVSAEDHELLKAEAEAHGCSVSYFVREVIRKYSPVTLAAKPRQGAPVGNSNRSFGRPLVRNSEGVDVRILQRANKRDEEPVPEPIPLDAVAPVAGKGIAGPVPPRTETVVSGLDTSLRPKKGSPKLRAKV